MSSPPVAVRAWPLVSSSRYRHPGDVIRLIGGIVLLGCSLTASAAALRWLLGPAAPVVDSLGLTRRVTTGLVQVSCLAVGAVAAAAIATGIFSLFGGQHPDALTDNLARGSWLASEAFPVPALIASA